MISTFYDHKYISNKYCCSSFFMPFVCLLRKFSGVKQKLQIVNIKQLHLSQLLLNYIQRVKGLHSSCSSKWKMHIFHILLKLGIFRYFSLFFQSLRIPLSNLPDFAFSLFPDFMSCMDWVNMKSQNSQLLGTCQMTSDKTRGLYMLKTHLVHKKVQLS